LNRHFTPGRVLAAVSLFLALAGCELLKHNEEALTIINGRVIGMPAGDFFDRYGRASSRSELAEGGMAYDWISSVSYAPPGPAGLDDRVCKLHLTADKRGRISVVQVMYDAPGMKSTSRCGEIFAAK
jgi:hypothetical protein